MDLLNECIRIAAQAGQHILRIYQSDFAVRQKHDQSPLTEADLAAHQYIAAALRVLTPEIPLLSEEGGDISYATRKAWPRYWLVDPLDGTKEFVRRNGEFTVNIALIEGNTPVLGAICAPVLNQSFGAVRGYGALRVMDGQARPIRTRRSPAKPVLLFSRSHRDTHKEDWLARAPTHEAVIKGSALKFCLIAAGEADFHARLGPTSEWDTAAGQCIVEEAGGCVLQLPEWAALRYNRKASLRNPSFVIAGDSSANWKSLFLDPRLPSFQNFPK